ncbi:hypothetical protein D6C76_06724 [Aureobasidium pullulans]|nr:hypothetical protein D6C79_09758 [Aureobasidium pullulans]TIA73146.1 hypothetical protein D6C76_06724 [Aureobasidium pullulans]
MVKSKSAQEVDTSTDPVRIAQSQPIVETTIGRLFKPVTRKNDDQVDDYFQSITFKNLFNAFPFEKLRLADYEKLNDSEMASEKLPGSPNAPKIPQPGSIRKRKGRQKAVAFF